jgi:putative FmdB family regulatory protein
MPTYEYACTECGKHIEVVQSMSDAPLTTCAICGGRLRKVFSPIGIVFKGSGFYRTDSRGKPAKSEPAAEKAGTADKGDKKPAAESTRSPSPSAKAPAKDKAAEKSA